MRAFLIIPLFIAGCLFHGPDTVRSEARQSVYKISVDTEVDTAPYCEGDSACLENVPKIGHIRWRGTGWIVARSNGRSYMMTAGHLCETSAAYELKKINWESLTVRSVSLPILDVKYAAESLDGTETKELTVRLDDDDVDLCLLSSPNDLGEPLPLAMDDPTYGEACHFIGAPHGLWGGGIAPDTLTTFSGRGKIFGEGPDALAFAGLGAPGASGSPIICGDRVAAVLTMGAVGYPGISTGVPHNVVRSFLSRAGHRPTR